MTGQSVQMLRINHASLLLVLSLAAAAACSANSGDSKVIAGSGASGGAGSGASGGAGGFIPIGGSDAGPDKDRVVVIGPGADASSPDKFGGEPVGAAPQVVYPEDGTVAPPNMNSLELHFVPGPGQTLFELTFESTNLTFVVYLGCTPVGAGCVYQPDPEFWDQLADGARGREPVVYSVRGVDGASPSTVGQSEPRELSFTEEDIVGGLYYWDDGGRIQRYDFGFALANAELYMTPQQAGAGVCVGCHVMSPNGRKMVVGKDIPAPAPYTVFDVASRQPVQGAGGPVAGSANFFTFSPDSNQLLYSNGVSIGWRDAVSGNTVNPQVVDNGTMPDWSSDGSLLVYARTSQPPIIAQPGIAGGSLEVRPFQSGSFGAATTLVQSQGENNYYPTFSPDSQWVLFNRSASNTNSFSNTVDGELWVVSRNGGSPIRLAAASAPGWCSWPKWAPGVHTKDSRPVMYFTFSSARAYGLRPAGTTQLWMTAFEPGKAGDPGYPAFRLPFQDPTTGNHIAQWVAEIVRRPCTGPGECDSGEECKDGVCVPPNVK